MNLFRIFKLWGLSSSSDSQHQHESLHRVDGPVLQVFKLQVSSFEVVNLFLFRLKHELSSSAQQRHFSSFRPSGLIFQVSLKAILLSLQTFSTPKQNISKARLFFRNAIQQSKSPSKQNFKSQSLLNVEWKTSFWAMVVQSTASIQQQTTNQQQSTSKRKLIKAYYSHQQAFLPKGQCLVSNKAKSSFTNKQSTSKRKRIKDY